MAVEAREFRAVQERAEALERWVAENAPVCLTEQKHLDEGSQERKYWTYGYVVALRDVIRLMTEANSPSRKSGRPDSLGTFPQA
jgi:hypothetical protein